MDGVPISNHLIFFVFNLPEKIVTLTKTEFEIFFKLWCDHVNRAAENKIKLL